MQLFATADFAPPPSLRLRRDRAERILNGLRAAVVFLLTASALMYAPHLSRALNIANVLVLGPDAGVDGRAVSDLVPAAPSFPTGCPR